MTITSGLQSGQQTSSAYPARRGGLLYGLFVRNINAKIALAPMMVTVLVVFVGCVIWTIIYSFTNSKLLPNGNFVGFDQYVRLFKDTRWQTSVRNIVFYSAFAFVFTIGVGFLLAVLMDQKIRFESAIRTIYLYPFALSFIITGLVWQWIMNPAFGLQASVRQLGWTSFTFDWLTNRDMVLFAMLIAGLWQGTGFVMVLLLSGLRTIDAEIWKAARIDGIPTWRTYIFIVVPMMRGTFITTFVIVGAGLVRLYDLVVALTGGGPGFASEVPTKYVYQYMFGAASIGQALAASTMMLVTVSIFVVPWALYEFGPRRNRL